MTASEKGLENLYNMLISSSQKEDRDVIAQKALKKSSDESSWEETEAEREKKLSNDDKQNDIRLKKHYGYGLIGVMIIQLIIMNWVFYRVGKGTLHYDNYSLHVYVTGTLLELFGLVLVITKYLFKQK